MAFAWSRPKLAGRRRAKISVIGLAAVTLTLTGALMLPRILDPLAASVVRDWLPYLLLLMFYWQAGQFVTRVDAGFQRRLERLDSRIVTPAVEWCKRSGAGRSMLTILELAYLFCYVSMPLGIAALYLMHLGREADRFWTVVLMATYACYGMLPFIQTQPPRTLPEKRSVQPPLSKVRALNLWVLRWGSIHANTFPSAHVACTMACALVLLPLAPGVGLLFLGVAILIALGAVAGRYHYAADAILGVMVALAAFLIQLAFDGGWSI
jgi:PAP2 superfamily protein